MPETNGNTDNRNEQFWLEMTKLGTLRFCNELLKISQEFQNKRPDNVDYEEYLKSIDEGILKYIDLINDSYKNGNWDAITTMDSPFPHDLHGYIHEYNTDGGKFQPRHLMCKLAVLRDDVNAINYEFLIEYDILRPDVEIYFGVKAISDNWDSTDNFRDCVLKQWQKVSLNKYKRYTHRFKMTTNVNNGTFWPFWWRMSIDCKEELSDTIQRIKTFYIDYKKELGLHDVKKTIFDEVAIEVANSLLSREDYDSLIEKIKKDYNNEVAERFKMVLQRCIDDGILAQKNGEWGTFICTKKIIKPVSLIRAFFECTIINNNEWLYNKGTPIEALSRVILDKHGRVINDSNWRKDKSQIEDYWIESINKMKQMFPDFRVKKSKK